MMKRIVRDMTYMVGMVFLLVGCGAATEKNPISNNVLEEKTEEISEMAITDSMIQGNTEAEESNEQGKSTESADRFSNTFQTELAVGPVDELSAYYAFDYPDNWEVSSVKFLAKDIDEVITLTNENGTQIQFFNIMGDLSQYMGHYFDSEYTIKKIADASFPFYRKRSEIRLNANLSTSQVLTMKFITLKR